MFPLNLLDEDLNWKVSLNYDLIKKIFLLHVNGISFHDMPIQYEVSLQGPQNIEGGIIMLNEDKVHDGWAQYDANTVYEWWSEIDKEPIEDLYIGGDSKVY